MRLRNFFTRSRCLEGCGNEFLSDGKTFSCWSIRQVFLNYFLTFLNIDLNFIIKFKFFFSINFNKIKNSFVWIYKKKNIYRFVRDFFFFFLIICFRTLSNRYIGYIADQRTKAWQTRTLMAWSTVNRDTYSSQRQFYKNETEAVNSRGVIW